MATGDSEAGTGTEIKIRVGVGLEPVAEGYLGSEQSRQHSHSPIPHLRGTEV